MVILRSLPGGWLLWIEGRLRAMGASIWVSAQSKPAPIRIVLKENHTFNSSGIVSDPYQEYPFPTGLGNERGSRSSQLRAIGRKLTRPAEHRRTRPEHGWMDPS